VVIPTYLVIFIDVDNYGSKDGFTNLTMTYNDERHTFRIWSIATAGSLRLLIINKYNTNALKRSFSIKMMQLPFNLFSF
jgi:hypothetical protein